MLCSFSCWKQGLERRWANGCCPEPAQTRLPRRQNSKRLLPLPFHPARTQASATPCMATITSAQHELRVGSGMMFPSPGSPPMLRIHAQRNDYAGFPPSRRFLGSLCSSSSILLTLHSLLLRLIHSVYTLGKKLSLLRSPFFLSPFLPLQFGTCPIQRANPFD